MEKKEMIRSLYKMCRKLSYDESLELVLDAESGEEQEFYEIVTNYFLQIKQREVVAQGKF